MQIFNAAGSQLSSTVENIIVACVQVLGTTLGAAVIDKLGRKPLLLLSGIFMAVSEVALGKTCLCHNCMHMSYSFEYVFKIVLNRVRILIQ